MKTQKEIFMKAILFLFGTCFLFFPSLAQEQDYPAIAPDIQKRTFTFVERDSALELDFYQRRGDTEIRPCVIFLFGGGFFTGDRDRPFYNTYFNNLVHHGLNVASIDYRLGLNEEKFKELGIFNTTPLEDAVRMAVEDLYAATVYLLGNAKELKIDPQQFLLSGSSAGAVTSLQGDWHHRNNDPVAEMLPADFAYQGVVAFAGAILSTTGKPKYDTPPGPVMMFHGTEDKVVPYNKLKLFNKGMFGSNYLAKYFHKQGFPYYFLRVVDAGHEIAGSPIYDNMAEILRFIETAILQNRTYQLEATLERLTGEQ